MWGDRIDSKCSKRQVKKPHAIVHRTLPPTTRSQSQGTSDCLSESAKLPSGPYLPLSSLLHAATCNPITPHAEPLASLSRDKSQAILRSGLARTMVARASLDWDDDGSLSFSQQRQLHQSQEVTGEINQASPIEIARRAQRLATKRRALRSVAARVNATLPTQSIQSDSSIFTHGHNGHEEKTNAQGETQSVSSSSFTKSDNHSKDQEGVPSLSTLWRNHHSLKELLSAEDPDSAFTSPFFNPQSR